MTSTLRRAALRAGASALCLLLLPGTLRARAGESVFKPRPAPALSLKDQSGRVRTLSEFKGRVVLLDFWASWCGPCKESFPALDSLQEEMKSDGLEVIAVNVDEDRKDADTFLAGRTPSMTLLFDQKGRSPEDFKVEGMPTTFLIDHDGNIRFRHMGFTEKTRADFRREISLLLKEAAPHADH